MRLNGFDAQVQIKTVPREVDHSCAHRQRGHNELSELGLTHFPVRFNRSPQNALRVVVEESFVLRVAIGDCTISKCPPG